MVVTDTRRRRARRKSRFGRLAGWQKALTVLVVLLLLLGGGLAGSAFYLYSRYDNKVAREDLLPDAASAADQEQRDENWESGALNLLLLGSDSRAGEAGGVSPIGERSDTIMLVHISRNRDKATIVSIPRDSYVDVPAGGSWKGGKNKINAAFAFGGAKLTAATVRQLTGVPLDGAMIANFAGVHRLVDAVDGVNVCVPYVVRSTFSRKVWPKGCHDMDGDEAEEFMRQRYEVPGGDFGRMYNQQLVVKAVIAEAAHGDMLTNPLKFDHLMVTAAEALTVDKSLDLRELALAVRGIRPAAIKYATVPYTSANLRTRAGSAVQLDKVKSAAMFAAIKADTIDEWLTAHPQKAPGS
uniref:LCP family protein n=1 Tax=Paractinoplanes polyasparticus TaxID=2856853 RepID=UPI001C85E829|nr:LCP family protein [Actinoplanes polyasparticus]